MSVIILLIIASLIVGLIFLGAFIWSVRTGQYEDTLTPSMRMLLDDARPPTFSGPTQTPSGSPAAPLPAAHPIPGAVIEPNKS
jgi:cbb3-type cytochrome oxidase maturation protein